MTTPRPLRIGIVGGFFLPVPPLRGGATEKIWHRLAQEFASAGHEVTYISRRWNGLPEEETAGGVRHRRLPGWDHSRNLALNLWRDVIWGARAGRALGPGDVVVCQAVTLPIWLPALKPAAGQVVVVLGRAPKGRLRFYRRVSRIFATSSDLARRVAAEAPSLAERTRVIWNPIDWKLHAGLSAQPSEPLVIGFAGRLHPEKGVELLLRAAARLAQRKDLPAWRLRLTGPVAVTDGGGGESWRQGLISRFGPSLGGRLEFRAAEYDPAALAREYGRTDVFCYPSLAEKGETFGVAVAEAMAAGAVPVVSALPCFAELVRDGGSGLVFDHAAGNAEALLEAALARLLLDPALRRKLAAQAQAEVRRFDYPDISAGILRELEGAAA